MVLVYMLVLNPSFAVHLVPKGVKKKKKRILPTNKNVPDRKFQSWSQNNGLHYLLQAVFPLLQDTILHSHSGF